MKTRCKKHYRYLARRAPLADCEECRKMWDEARGIRRFSIIAFIRSLVRWMPRTDGEN